VQLTYYHGDDGGQLLVDGKKPFRHYHIGPCTSFTSVMFGGMTVQMSAGGLTVSAHLGSLTALSTQFRLPSSLMVVIHQTN